MILSARTLTNAEIVRGQSYRHQDSLFVSSMSAFAGCRSFYGRAKLLGEQVAFETAHLWFDLV